MRGCLDKYYVIDRPLISYREVLDKALPPLIWDVQPLISRGDRVIVFGETFSLKSWIMLHMALHLGAAADWLGFKVPEQRRVLYVDEEMNERTLRRRVKRLGQGAGLTLDEPVQFLSRAGVRFDAYGAHTLLSYLTKHHFKPDVIIIDSLRRVMLGDENKTMDVAPFWRNLEPLSRDGTTVQITHHMNKPPMEGKRALRYRASGNTDILAGADAAFSVERLGPDTACITGIKARDDVEHSAFTVRLDDAGDRQGPVRLVPAQVEVRDDVFRPVPPPVTRQCAP